MLEFHDGEQVIKRSGSSSNIWNRCVRSLQEIQYKIRTSVLIYGSSGGVGTFAVQIAKAMGGIEKIFLPRDQKQSLKESLKIMRKGKCNTFTILMKRGYYF